MTIIFLGIAWLVGIWLASVVELPLWLWITLGAVSILAAILLRKQVPAGMWLAMLGVLCLGAARQVSAAPVIDENHIAFYNGRDEVTVTGVVVDEPEIRDRTIQLKVESEKLEDQGGQIVPVGGLLLVTAPRFPIIPYGTEVRVTGRLQEPENLGDFDYKSYLARQNVHSQMSWPELTAISEGHGNPVYYGIYAFKGRAQATIKSLLPNPHAALLSGILLGNDSELSPDLDEAFRITGMTHIIAISGFNIAILAAILLKGSRPFVGLRGSAWVALVGIALYTILVGADAAVVRAAIMGGLFIIAARFIGRPTYAPAALFAAAIAMTLLNPNILWDIGFQLSFAATLGLMLYIGPWSRWTEAGAQRIISPQAAKRLVRFLGDIVIATLAALLLTLPLMAYHFGQLSVVSPLANLFILPAQAGIMAWGILAALTGMVLQPLGQLLAWVDWLFLDYTIDRVRFFSTLPAASVEVAAPLAAVVAIYVLIFGLTFLARQSKPQRYLSHEALDSVLKWGFIFSGLAIITGLILSFVFSQHDGNLHVSFIDVGQGDATLITTPSGRQILVDGGAYPSVIKDELGQQLPFWKKNIDIIIATHPDSDHVAALPTLFEHYEIGRLITNGQAAAETGYQELLAAAANSGTTVQEANAGDIIFIEDGVHIDIINSSNPQSQIPDPDIDNDSSIALRLIYTDFSLLITGDAGWAAEQEMIASGVDLTSIVYKAGHHGSNSSSGAPFLTAVGPDIAVISAGIDNQYGHPHPAVLSRLSESGAAVLRTDELGTIEVITDGHVMWWEANN